ncbi:MAG TPA: hypothetical protein VEA81_16425 [Burkholderiaceae bacterium]|nr:hypothetical protein [Burkholderiaceae bacterium]
MLRWLLAPAVAAVGPPASGVPADDGRRRAEALCAVLAARVDEIPGRAPVLLRSWDGEAGRDAPAEPALRSAAFSYDNALAAIALVACERREQATRIGEALLAASLADRSGSEGRLRNAYRAGAQTERPVPPMGWWDAASRRWAEDPYQVGSATGNVAWGALALLTLAEASGERRYVEGAARLAGWAVSQARDARGPGGFSGGLHGWDDAPQALRWKSTEHNVDLAAVFDRLDRAGAPGRWRSHATHARAFLDAMWAEGRGRFPVGTLPDGTTTNHSTSGLDAQLWPLLLRDAPERWRAALGHAERAHGVEGGFDFNDDRDGLWVEGTAQAALAYRVLGRRADADRLLAEIARQASPGGYLWATREPQVTTGLALRPDSTTDDFRYFRRPHLGATAWAVLAGTGWNPFTGKRVP